MGAGEAQADGALCRLGLWQVGVGEGALDGGLNVLPGLFDALAQRRWAAFAGTHRGSCRIGDPHAGSASATIDTDEVVQVGLGQVLVAHHGGAEQYQYSTTQDQMGNEATVRSPPALTLRAPVHL
jgi:hypothetical protein